MTDLKQKFRRISYEDKFEINGADKFETKK